MLSSLIYTLLKPVISQMEMVEVKSNLERFVTEYELFYGKSAMTMNVHMITHLTECVENLGPLWEYSMFAFESFNGRLKKSGYSNNVVNQIAEYCTIKATQVDKKSEQTKYLSNEIYLQISTLSIIESNAIQRLGNCTFYAAYHKGPVIFTSTSYTLAKKTSDFFISIQSGRMGKVKYFFKSNEAMYVVLEEFILEKRVDQFVYVTKVGCSIICSVQEIEDKFIYMEFGLHKIVVKRPNHFEVN